ncbi:MAG: hypothetical protein HOW73_13330 [Polyangiaceae bacterium]|nr:hypothetical protein [Polyangiaceae bacterium]
MTKAAHWVGLGLMGVVLMGCGIITIKPKDGGGATSGPDQGIQGPLHEANKGKIVFAKNQIPKDAAATFVLADTFRLDEQIYSRAFFEKSPRNSLAGLPDPDTNCKWDNRRNLTISAWVDGGSEHGIESHIAGDKTWATYTTFYLTGEDGSLLPTEQVVLPQHRNKAEAKIALLLSTLGDGDHTIKLETEANCNGNPKSSLATGEMKVTVDAAGRTHLAKLIRLAEAGLKTQPDETKRLTAAAEATFNKTKVLHFRPIEDAWRVRRGPLEEPIDRSIIALSLLEEGGKCTLRTSEIVEAHEGGGKYGAPVFRETVDGAIGEMTDLTVPCDIDVQK